MVNLSKVVEAFGDEMFASVLKSEIESLDPALLPLQENLTQGSYANGDQFDAVVLRVAESAGFIDVKAGIFYAGVIAGCACADDPTPENETSEYCEILIRIDRKTGLAELSTVE